MHALGARWTGMNFDTSVRESKAKEPAQTGFIRLTGAVPPILFHLAFVRDFASFGAAERQMH